MSGTVSPRPVCRLGRVRWISALGVRPGEFRGGGLGRAGTFSTMLDEEPDQTDLFPLSSLDWEALSHRQVMAELIGRGWVPCGLGDWAVGLRSPRGTHVARVCPFDPAYAAFVRLCARCAGNRWLPRVEVAGELEGGGSVAVLEYLAPVEPERAALVANQWRAGEGDAELAEVRRAAQEIDAEYRLRTPWWDGLDLNSAHVRRAVDGRLVLIDVFCMDGVSLYGQILKDVTKVHGLIPRERMRYALEIPYIARESSAAEIRALQRAWARAAS